MSITMTGGGRTFDLHPLESLLTHEEVIPSNLDTRLNKLVSKRLVVRAPGLEPKSCSKEIFSLTEGDIYTVFGRYS